MKTSAAAGSKPPRNNRASAGGERALVAAIRSRAWRPAGPVRLGIGDDCAVLRPPAGHEIVITTDMSLEQVHFRRDWHPPEAVGHRCLARGLSDLAAMGARPLAAFLSMALPPELASSQSGRSWIDRFLDGLLALAAKAGVTLAGGDTAQSPRIGARGEEPSGLVAADIVLVGAVRRGRALLRSGARAGDIIYVTGALGGAAAELLALERDPARFARFTQASEAHPHLFPQPRLKAAQRLVAARRIHSAIDLSDGLSTDLAHLCEESDLAAELDADAIPIHPLALQAEQAGHAGQHSPALNLALNLALNGGEDYELLFTAPKSTPIPRKIAGVSLHPIGRMIARRTRQPKVTLRERDGRTTALEPGGWEHFR